jgi:hypothetical protein
MTLRRPTGKISIQPAYNSAVQTARLYVNNTANSSISRGSNFVLDLEPGDYTLQLKNGNLKSEAVPVTLRDNQSVAVSLSVSKPKGFVTLTYSGESAHAWATIYIDGKQSDRIRRGQSKRFELDTGAHTFEVRAHRESAQQRLIVSARRERSLTLTIERKMGRLAVSLNANSSVSSAQITINGQSRGSITRGQTLTYDDMAPGTATVIMSANGMTEQGQTQITRGQTSSLTLTLKQQVGTLVVSLLPESRAAFARVLINGSYKFTVNRGQTRKLDLPAGVYTVILDGGRAPQTVQQVVEAGKVSQIVMNLQ